MGQYNTNGESYILDPPEEGESENEEKVIEWKNFVFKPAEPANYQEILDHLGANFYLDEPLNHLAGNSAAKAKDMDAIVMQHIPDGLSHIVLEKETNEVAGARIISLHRRGDDEDAGPDVHSPEMKKIWSFLRQVDEDSDVFKLYPDLDCYVELFMASVDRRFRGQGLATQMFEGAIPFLKSRGIPLVKSCFTSPFTQRIGNNLGFTELTRRCFRDYKDENGEIVFPNAGEKDVAVVGALHL